MDRSLNPSRWDANIKRLVFAFQKHGYKGIPPRNLYTMIENNLNVAKLALKNIRSRPERFNPTHNVVKDLIPTRNVLKVEPGYPQIEQFLNDLHSINMNPLKTVSSVTKGISIEPRLSGTHRPINQTQASMERDQLINSDLDEQDMLKHRRAQFAANSVHSEFGFLPEDLREEDIIEELDNHARAVEISRELARD